MAVVKNEQEQVEMLKEWWQENGKFTVIAFILTAAAVLGWNAYKRHQVASKQQASALYQQMMYSFAQEKQNAFVAQANKIINDHADLPYANLASFVLAKSAIDSGKYDEAVKQFQHVVATAKDDRIRQIARIRAARVLLAQDKPNDALQLLATVDNKTFLPLINEVRGDIYVAKGDTKNARESYQAALNEMSEDELNRSILEMKFEQLSQHGNALA